MDADHRLQTIHLPDGLDVYAPDGSEIRFLATTARGSMVHCRLPPGSISSAVVHRTVEELWYFTAGEGQAWRKLGDDEQVQDLRPGLSLNIPTGAHFQFRCTGAAPLEFVIVTMPPWPGEAEAVPVAGKWEPVDSRSAGMKEATRVG